MRVRFALPAVADLEDILDYIAADSPIGANRVAERVDAVLELIRSFPEAGLATNEPGIRRINTRPYPYLLFYEILDGEILVHSVRHGAQRLPDTIRGPDT